MTRIRTPVTLAIALTLPRCSLSGLDDFPLARCESDSVCEPLNAQRGPASDACQRFVCERATQRCVLRTTDRDGDGAPSLACGGTDCDDTDPRSRGGADAPRESCDGRDNNCNGIIDEGALLGFEEVSLGQGPGIVGNVSIAAGPGDSMLAVHAAPGSAPRAWGLGSIGQVSTPTPGYAVEAGPRSPMLLPGCRILAGANPVMCQVGSLALAAATEGWFTAAVDTAGCARGVLRLGLAVADGAALTVVQRGPAALSNIALPVDPDAQGCGGGARPEGAPRGVRGASLASADGSTALVAWRAQALNLEACANVPPTPIEAMGLWRESGAFAGATPSWLNGTQDGRPSTLGLSAGTEGPSVAAWAGQGFALAYPGADSRPLIQFVESLGAPPAFDGAIAGAIPEVSRRTMSLRPSATATIHGAPMVDTVVLSALPVAPGDLEWTLGLAWREGCTGSGSIGFARVRVAPGGNITADPAVQLGRGTSLSAPVIIPVSNGLVGEGFARAGGTTVGARSGGWLVAWSVGSVGVFARRVLAADGAALESEASLVLPDARVLGAIPRSAAGAGSAGRILVSDAQSSLRVRDVICRAR